MKHFIFILTVFAYSANAQTLSWREAQPHQKLELLLDGKVITAYCYFDSTEKPILFPLRTVSGTTVTRGYPIAPRPGERTDHPHHTELWMNYESVNGLDFWNNSFAIPTEKKSHYGSIRHKKINFNKAKRNTAALSASSQWVDPNGSVLIDEVTTFAFTVRDHDFIIDRKSELKAVNGDVSFKDVKDGFLGLRVARSLEMPSKQEDKFVDAHGNVTTTPALNNEGVTGQYLNREGISGDDTWGKRSVWTTLSGMIDDEAISIGIIDHPSNVGYPTYWHARGYGLFAANPLGQSVFSNGKEQLNYVLKNGQSVIFSYRIIIHNGSTMTPDMMNELTKQFHKLKP